MFPYFIISMHKMFTSVFSAFINLINIKKKLLPFKLCLYTGWNFWESAASFVPREAETPPPNRPRSSISNRMAISFPKPGGDIPPLSPTIQTKQPSALSHFVNLSTDDDKEDFAGKEKSYKDNEQLVEDNGDSSDLEIEDEDEVESEVEGEDEVSREDRKLYVPTATTATSKPFTIVPKLENKASSFTMGRGRGMVKFGSNSPRAPGVGYNKEDQIRKNLPVAKVSPTERNFGGVSVCNDNDVTGRNGENQTSSNWRNRDERKDRETTSMDDETEHLSWRNNRKHDNDNNSSSVDIQQSRYQDYHSAGESRSQTNNRKYRNLNNRSDADLTNMNKNHRHQKREKKSWRNLNLKQENSNNFTRTPPEQISGPPTVTKGHPGRFQASFHSNKNSIAKSNKQAAAGNDEGVSGFGTDKPKMCFRCSSLDHITEECTANNFFF